MATYSSRNERNDVPARCPGGTSSNYMIISGCTGFGTSGGEFPARIGSPSRSISESSETELIPNHKRSVRIPGCLSDRLVMIIVIVSVVLCIIFAAIIAMLFSQVNDLQEKFRKFETDNNVNGKIHVCLKCSELDGKHFKDDKHVRDLDEMRQPGAGNICCAKTPEQTKLFLVMVQNAFIPSQSTEAKLYQQQEPVPETNGSKNTDEKSSPNCCDDANSHVKSSFTPGSISAHVLIGKQNANTGNGHQMIRNWSGVVPPANLTGIKLQDDKLIVGEKGLYLIYSQILFSIYNEILEVREAILLDHNMYRHNSKHRGAPDDCLLRSVNVASINHWGGYADVTSFTSAALRLDANDELYVTVSNGSYVSRDRKASFFGVVKIKG